MAFAAAAQTNRAAHTNLSEWMLNLTQRLCLTVSWVAISAASAPTLAADAGMQAWDRGSDLILATPHGRFDRGTGAIVKSVCKQLRWNCLVAAGYRREHAPVNVNRPTEGVRLGPREERKTDRAAAVYAEYHDNWLSLGGPRARLYVEVHGNSRPQSQSHIEIATVGFTKPELRAIRAILVNRLAAGGLPANLEVMLEGIDRIYYRARSTKWFGILGHTRRGLHFEFPRALRSKSRRHRIVAYLTDTLPRIAHILR